jgi:hypothetical protein
MCFCPIRMCLLAIALALACLDGASAQERFAVVSAHFRSDTLPAEYRHHALVLIQDQSNNALKSCSMYITWNFQQRRLSGRNASCSQGDQIDGPGDLGGSYSIVAAVPTKFTGNVPHADRDFVAVNQERGQILFCAYVEQTVGKTFAFVCVPASIR